MAQNPVSKPDNVHGTLLDRLPQLLPILVIFLNVFVVAYVYITIKKIRQQDPTGSPSNKKSSSPLASRPSNQGAKVASPQENPESPRRRSMVQDTDGSANNTHRMVRGKNLTFGLSAPTEKSVSFPGIDKVIAITSSSAPNESVNRGHKKRYGYYSDTSEEDDDTDDDTNGSTDDDDDDDDDNDSEVSDVDASKDNAASDIGSGVSKRPQSSKRRARSKKKTNKLAKAIQQIMETQTFKSLMDIDTSGKNRVRRSSIQAKKLSVGVDGFTPRSSFSLPRRDEVKSREELTRKSFSKK